MITVSFPSPVAPAQPAKQEDKSPPVPAPEGMHARGPLGPDGNIASSYHHATTARTYLRLPLPSPTATPSPSEERLNWARQWYAVMFTEDLQDDVPRAITVIGKPLAIWRDAEVRPPPHTPRPTTARHHTL
jgi:hypothetical protein